VVITRSKVLKKLTVFFLISTLLFNVFDATATIWVVTRGLAEEANPLLVGPLQTSPLLFIAIKTILAGGGTYLMWRRRDHMIVVLGAYIVFTVYWSLVLWFWFGVSAAP
jgi:hypothetical protein